MFPKGMLVFNYDKDINYPEYLHINVLDIDKDEIPYINEIESKIPNNNNIYQFSIMIIKKI